MPTEIACPPMTCAWIASLAWAAKDWSTYDLYVAALEAELTDRLAANGTFAVLWSWAKRSR